MSQSRDTWGEWHKYLALPVSNERPFDGNVGLWYQQRSVFCYIHNVCNTHVTTQVSLTRRLSLSPNDPTCKNTADNLGKNSLVELKNERVYFKQKCISYEKQSETLQGTPFLLLAPWALPRRLGWLCVSEIVNFRQMLEERIESQASPLTAIPDIYKPLIAKLAHERCANFPSGWS